MNSERLIGAVSKLSSVAVEYPELSSGVTSLIAGLLNGPPPGRSGSLFDLTVGRMNGDGLTSEPIHRNGYAAAIERGLNGHADRAVAVDEEIKAETVKPKSKRVGPTTPKQWYTLKEASVLLGKGIDTLGYWLRQGRLSGRKCTLPRRGSAPWLISAIEIERYKASGLREYGDTCNVTN